MLEFDADTHTYSRGGITLPSVTTILRPLYDFSRVNDEVMAAACEFGTHVHATCELYDLDDLDEESLDPALAEYLDGWKKFRAETGFRVAANEQVVEARIHGYSIVGTLDRVGFLGDDRVLIDLKTSAALSPVTGPQTAAYANAYTAMTGHKIKRRYGLLLKPGGYKLIECADKSDFSTFLACKQIFDFRTKHNLHKGD